MIKKQLPSEITSYDLLKTFAVIIMVIDHLGAYLFPEHEWFRAVGRICVPIWFFLIGYANTRQIPKRMVMGTAALVVANFVVGMPVFAINVFFTMICIRLILDKTIKFIEKSAFHMVMATVLMIGLIYPTDRITEYGTQGLMMAIAGFYIRHNGPQGLSLMQKIFCFLSLFCFVIFQQFYFGFSEFYTQLILFETVFIGFVLMHFKSMLYPRFTSALPFYVSDAVKFCGRYTLEIYVVHLLVLKFTALALGMQYFSLFDFKLFFQPGG